LGLLKEAIFICSKPGELSKVALLYYLVFVKEKNYKNKPGLVIIMRDTLRTIFSNRCMKLWMLK